MARDLMQKLRSPTLPRIVRRSLGRILAIVATKTEAGVTPDNGPFLRNDAAYRSTSPFPSDRSAQTHR
ncbi:MAG: hypothetical protein JWM63_914 [Gammaproteobacteria bacterium]|nr:hypothetical protein [Gammaproteobacteria bacterium]